MRSIIMTSMTEMWPAPFHPSPITHTQQVPGSKSMTNRAYILSALASGPSTIVGALLPFTVLAALLGIPAWLLWRRRRTASVPPTALPEAPVSAG